ncbi:MAG: DUF4293 domain-containing protein [Bacteroidales bacterium OttesenSCG-928-I14]|jgi:hypothetical protein|nr:DUF4293 domain-containing protein [Bacteroidales bacterium OttesenSCG-928-I14]
MIQRIQTVLLLAIAIILGLVMFVINRNFPLLRDGWLIIFTSIIAVFLFKKRLLQIKICYLILILLSFFLIKIFLLKLYLLSIFVVVAMCVDILAIRAIRRDEKLIHSFDRLR